MKRTIGVLGGMGPAATVHFLHLIVSRTAAGTDQEHIPVLTWSDPRIPSRVDAVLGTGPSPLSALLEGVRVLQAGGAGLLVMPCITAHCWAREIASSAGMPFINLILEARRHLAQMPRAPRRVGLIASTGTVAAHVFQTALERQGIQVLTPDSRAQDRVMAAIFGEAGIKAAGVTSPPRAAIVRVARRLVEQGAEAIIAGCTEVPLVLRQNDLTVPLVDPMLLGVDACITKAGFRVRR